MKVARGVLRGVGSGNGARLPDYNGYQIKDQTLYNPFSIINFIADAFALTPNDTLEDALGAFWVNSGSTRLIEKLLKNNLSELWDDLACLVQRQAIKTTHL